MAGFDNDVVFGDSIKFVEATVDKWHIGNFAADDSFKISQGGTLGTNDTFIMTAAGERTMPLQPAVLVTNTAAGQLNATGDGTQLSVIFGTEIYDQNSDFDGISTFTAPVTGRYLVTAHISFEGLAAAHTFTFSSINTSNRVYLIDPINIGAIRTVNPNDRGFTSVNQVVDLDASDALVINIGISNGAKTVGIIAGGTSTDPRTRL
ncbi:MAG: hypothetical protein ACE5GV_00455, partial [Candidatus Scalindua sp.]